MTNLPRSIAYLGLTFLLSLQGTAIAATTVPTRAATSSAPARAITQPTDPQEGSTDYLMEIKGVEGESTKAPGVEPDEIDARVNPEEGSSIDPDEIDYKDEPQEGSTDYLLEIDDVKGESTEKKKGNVEYNWKVEEGEKAPGVEPDEIDYDEDPQPVMPDFSILLGGGSETDDEETNTPLEDLILNGLKEEGAPAETMSLNFEEIKTTAKQSVKFLGLIPMSVTATVKINSAGEVKVKYPWWSFLVSGKDGDSLGQLIFDALVNVMETKKGQIGIAVGDVNGDGRY